MATKKKATSKKVPTRKKKIKVLPNGCEVSTVTVRGQTFQMERCTPGDESSAEYSVYKPGKATVGRMSLFFGASRTMVRKIEVAPEVQRSGLGTRFYEQALEESCHRGTPLESDSTRSAFAEAFWLKQQKKGRAICILPTPMTRSSVYAPTEVSKQVASTLPKPIEGRRGLEWPCLYFQVTEPCKTKSLAGLPETKRRKKT